MVFGGACFGDCVLDCSDRLGQGREKSIEFIERDKKLLAEIEGKLVKAYGLGKQEEPAPAAADSESAPGSQSLKKTAPPKNTKPTKIASKGSSATS